MTRVIGIDPGINGALVCLKDGRPEHMRRLPFRGNVLNSHELIRWLHALKPDLVTVEEFMAVRAQGLTSTVTGARNFGKIEACVESLGLPLRLTLPREWHRSLEFPGDERPAKAKALERVRALYPEVNLVPPGCRVPHDGIVDALLIAHFGLHHALRFLDRAR